VERNRCFPLFLFGCFCRLSAAAQFLLILPRRFVRDFAGDAKNAVLTSSLSHISGMRCGQCGGREWSHSTDEATGYKPHVASAIEAVSPRRAVDAPVMGAAAFVIRSHNIPT